VFAAAANVLVRTLLAPACAACDGVLDAPLTGAVCAACWQAVPRLTPPLCVRCGDSVPVWRARAPECARCRRVTTVVSLARSAGRYDGSLRLIIHALKYGRRRALAAPLGALMREAGRDVLASADAVVPVPIHPFRALQRGFNQADDLACQLGLPVWRALRRVRHGPPQAGLPAARRHANVRAAFQVRLPLPRLVPGDVDLQPWIAGRLRNRSVVLVDDVMTTGATLEACGRVLREAGVRRVCAMTAARAVAAQPASHLPRRLPADGRRR
jgi:ComF family protein